MENDKYCIIKNKISSIDKSIKVLKKIIYEQELTRNNLLLEALYLYLITIKSKFYNRHNVNILYYEERNMIIFSIKEIVYMTATYKGNYLEITKMFTDDDIGIRSYHINRKAEFKGLLEKFTIRYLCQLH